MQNVNNIEINTYPIMVGYDKLMELFPINKSKRTFQAYVKDMRKDEPKTGKCFSYGVYNVGHGTVAIDPHVFKEYLEWRDHYQYRRKG